jgi:hypothetical protein
VSIDEAAMILAARYSRAAEGQKVTQLYLFAIEYADQIANMSKSELAVRAGCTNLLARS